MDDKYHLCFIDIVEDKANLVYFQFNNQVQLETYIKDTELSLDSIVVIKNGTKLKLENKIVMSEQTIEKEE